MSLRTVDIVEKYDSGIQNVVEDFYLPVLKESINYDRIAGSGVNWSRRLHGTKYETMLERKMRCLL